MNPIMREASFQSMRYPSVFPKEELNVIIQSITGKDEVALQDTAKAAWVILGYGFAIGFGESWVRPETTEMMTEELRVEGLKTGIVPRWMVPLLKEIINNFLDKLLEK